MADAAESTAPARAPAASTSAAPAPDAALGASSLAPGDDALLARTERAFVRDGDNVLLKLPSGILKPVKITPNGSVSRSLCFAVSQESCLTSHRACRTVGLGKYGTFKGRELIGRPYGHTYEIGEDGKLSVLQATLNEIGAPCFPRSEGTTADSRGCEQRRRPPTTSSSRRRERRRSLSSTSRRSRRAVSAAGCVADYSRSFVQLKCA